MGDLRFFADMMHEALRIERELNAARLEAAAVRERAATYAKACQAEKLAVLPFHGNRLPIAFERASEGLCAVRIIFGNGVAV
jgi:hypothetical protein